MTLKALSSGTYLALTGAAFLATLALYLFGALFLIQTELFVTHSSNISQIISTTKFASLRNVNADILIVGDSTAVVGVDPALVSETSGLSAYNLSLTVGSFIAVDDIMVERYLRLNRPPRFIVLYIGPWTTPTRPEAMVTADNVFALQYPSWEATFALLNFAPTATAIDYFRRFPGQLRSLLRFSITQFWRGFASGPEKHARIAAAIAHHQGWIPLESGIAAGYQVKAISDGCRYPAWELAPDVEFISDFRRKYETPSTKVLVFISPIPDCDESLPFLTEAYRGIADRPPSTMPHRYFAYDTPRHNHLLEAGSALNSREVGRLIAKLAQ